MNATRALPTSLFLPLLATLSARPHGQGLFYASPIPPGPCTAIVAGDLDGNLCPEVAVIQSSKLIVFQNPDTNGAAFEVASDVLDVCYWPTAGGEGAPGLLFTTPSGLGVATFVHDEFSPPYPCLAMSYPLQGATRIRYAVDQGQEKLFFVASDSKSFYSAAIVGGEIADPVLLFTLGPTVLDFVLLDYLNNGSDAGLDFGILHSNGVNIRSQGNIVYLARPGLQSGDAIAAVRHPASAQMKDSLAWITRLAGGIPHLFVFNTAFGPSPYVSIQLSPDDTVLYASAASADVDGNGIEDIVMGRTTSWIDVQKLNDPSLDTLFSGGLVGVDMATTSGPTPMAKILCTDLFNETNPADVPVPGFAAMLPEKNGLRLEHALPPPPPPPPCEGCPLPIPGALIPDFDGVRYESAMHHTDDPSTTETDCQSVAPLDTPPRAEWTINLGHGWGFTSANYIELIVRRCPGSTTAAEDHALAHLIFPIDTTYANDSATDDDEDGVGIYNTQITFHAGQGENDADQWTTEDLGSRYFAMVRPILLEYPPNFASMIRAWRWEILGMSASCLGSSWLADRGTGEFLNINTVVCGDIDICGIDMGGGGNRLPPKAVPQSSIPETGPNVLPVIYDPPYNN